MLPVTLIVPPAAVMLPKLTAPGALIVIPGGAVCEDAITVPRLRPPELVLIEMVPPVALTSAGREARLTVSVLSPASKVTELAVMVEAPLTLSGASLVELKEIFVADRRLAFAKFKENVLVAALFEIEILEPAEIAPLLLSKPPPSRLMAMFLAEMMPLFNRFVVSMAVLPVLDTVSDVCTVMEEAES